jgi:uncharacterized delta-60 repeat protein
VNEGAQANAVAIQVDGQILVAGTNSSGLANDFLLARYTAQGILDANFGTKGLLFTDFLRGQDIVEAIAIQGDGKIIVGGPVTDSTSATTGGFGIARYCAAPSLSVGDAPSQLEGDATKTNSATFTVTLSAIATAPVTISYQTADNTAKAGIDYKATNGTLNFAIGERSKTIKVEFIGDNAVEDDETFFLNLSMPTNAILADAQALGTITNDDTVPSISMNDVSLTEGNSGSQNLVFTATLSASSPSPVSVQYATTNGSATAGSDYTTTSGTLTIPAGQTSGTISVPVLGDTIPESNDTFFVTLSNPVNATLQDNRGIGTILNDDVGPSLSINDVSVLEGNSGFVNATFTVTLSVASNKTVTVNAIPTDGTARAYQGDYTSGGSRLTFAPGEVSKTISVPVKGDTLDEPNELFYVLLSSSINATLSKGRGIGTIQDDDAAPSLSIDDVQLGEGNSGQRAAAFRLKLSAPSGQVVKVNFATANGTATAGSDYVATSGQAAFNVGSQYVYVRVLVNGDTTFEPNETFVVKLSNVIGATLIDAQAVGTILNDDASN